MQKVGEADKIGVRPIVKLKGDDVAKVFLYCAGMLMLFKHYELAGLLVAFSAASAGFK